MWKNFLNRNSRNLSPAERLVAAEKLREKIAEEAKERQRESGGDKRSEEYRQDQKN